MQYRVYNEEELREIKQFFEVAGIAKLLELSGYVASTVNWYELVLEGNGEKQVTIPREIKIYLARSEVITKKVVNPGDGKEIYEYNGMKFIVAGTVLDKILIMRFEAPTFCKEFQVSNA